MRAYAARSGLELWLLPQFHATIWLWACINSVTHQLHEDREGSRVEVQLSICIFIFRFSSRKSRMPFSFLDQ